MNETIVEKVKKKKCLSKKLFVCIFLENPLIVFFLFSLENSEN